MAWEKEEKGQSCRGFRRKRCSEEERFSGGERRVS